MRRREFCLSLYVPIVFHYPQFFHAPLLLEDIQYITKHQFNIKTLFLFLFKPKRRILRRKWGVLRYALTMTVGRMIGTYSLASQAWFGHIFGLLPEARVF